jgi:outer membrane protein assembly factor BamE (lipoprotein component of BamABCDE complex)
VNSFSGVSVSLLAAFLLSACANAKLGRDFEMGVFAARVEQGNTTQNMVRSWLGEPVSIGASLATDGERFDEWAYYFAEGNMADMSTAKVKILQIKFDKQGKVRAYYWSASKQ